MNKLVKEPILHFLLAGILMYGLAWWIRGPELMPDDEDTIVVDRETVLTFLQFRANAFDADSFAQALDAMSEEDLQEFIASYVEEEVLFREASKLELDESDYIIRQRMVQKMSYLLSDLAGGETDINEVALNDYFANNKEVYLIKPSTTFTHVYFNVDERGEEQAYQDALMLLEEFNANAIGFNDVSGEGDRFPFLKNYVERTVEYVQGHFGVEFANTLLTLNPSSQEWQGPFQSAFGYHNILLTDLQESAYPELSQVRADVERDYLRERSAELLKDMTQSVTAQYDVIIEEGIQERAE